MTFTRSAKSTALALVAAFGLFAQTQTAQAGSETLTVAGGCFWCTESDFDKIHGVVSTISGYMGGHVPNPTYEQVSSGKTGHIEVVQVYYDPARIDFAALLVAFWPTIDPLTPNGQFCDMGPQYRSAIFYHNAKQQALIASSKQTLDASGRFNQPVVTEILPATEVYPAEDYHQDYFKNNPGNGYCQLMIPAKIAKLKKAFGDLVKEEK